MSVSALPIRVATKLAVVAQPRVGAFNHPSESESEWLFDQDRGTWPGTPLNVEIAQAAIGQSGTDLGTVVTAGRGAGSRSRRGAPIGRRRRASGGASRCRLLRAPSMAHPSGMPRVGGDRPFPSQFGPICRGSFPSQPLHEAPCAASRRATPRSRSLAPSVTTSIFRTARRNADRPLHGRSVLLRSPSHVARSCSCVPDPLAPSVRP